MPQTTIGRLTQLREKPLTQRDTYYRAIDAGRGLSARLYRWMGQYDAERHSAEWQQYCELHRLSPMHRAVDLFA